MSVLATDAFTRADAATLGANWAAMKGTSGQLGITSNQAAQKTGAGNRGGSYYAPGVVTFPNDQYSKATRVVAASAAMATVVRAITTGTQRNCYLGGNDVGDFGGSANDIRLWKQVASVLTSLGTGTGALANGDVIQTQAVGTTIDVLVNGISKVSVTDSSLASGQPGLWIEHSADSVAIWDDWEGGDFAAAGQPAMRRFGLAAFCRPVEIGHEGVRVFCEWVGSLLDRARELTMLQRQEAIRG